jgi:hypothetical protein
MSVVLDSSGNSTRGSGIVIPLMFGSLSARPLRVAAFFTRLFLLIADGGVWAANGLPRHVIPISPLDQFVHRGGVRTDYFSIHGNRIHMASNDRAPMAYFLDQWPADFDLTKLSSEAKDVVIAKGRASLVFVDSNVLPRMGSSSSTLLVQMKGREPPLAYFLLERPVDLSLSTLPANAQNVLVARVRLSDSLLYLVGRAIDSMSPPPGDLYLARLEILSVLQGEAPSESRPLVTFWPRDNARLDIPPAVPLTPKQLATDYFVVMYSDSKGLHLAGFPMSDAAYHEWEQERSEFHRERRNDLLPKR